MKLYSIEYVDDEGYCSSEYLPFPNLNSAQDYADIEDTQYDSVYAEAKEVTLRDYDIKLTPKPSMEYTAAISETPVNTKELAKLLVDEGVVGKASQLSGVTVQLSNEIISALSNLAQDGKVASKLPH